MLRDMKCLPTALSPARRAGVVGLVVLAAVVAAGLRGPDDNRLFAQRSAAAAATEAADLTYFTADGGAVIVLRPAALLQSLGSDEVSALLRESLVELHGLNPEELSLVAVQVGAGPRRGSPTLPGPMRMLLRGTEPTDWKSMLERLDRSPLSGAQRAETTGEARQASGKTYYVLGDTAYFQPDDRTIVFDRPAQIERYLAGQPGNKPLLESDAWKEMAGAQVAVAVESAMIREQLAPLGPGPQRTPGAALAGQLAPFAPFWQNTKTLYAAATFNGQLQVEAFADVAGQADAERVQATAEASLVLGQNFVAQVSRDLERSPAPEAPILLSLFGAAETLLNQAEIKSEGARVSVTATADKEAVPVGEIAAGLHGMRQAARRMASVNNLKQIGLAFHNFHAVHGRLPRVAETVTFDSRTTQYPHSWRVALLPYIDQMALYREYNFQEPWDSEANLKLLGKIPAVYRHAEAPAGTTSASFYVFTGPQTPFPGDDVEFSDVVDGTSNTLLAVEAKRDIPWTKPEDIPYAADQPLPQLGGFTDKSGFLAARMDGSVHYFTNALEAQTMRLLIDPADKQVLPRLP